VLQYAAACCSVVQCVAACPHTQNTCLHVVYAIHSHVAVCWSVLQCVTACPHTRHNLITSVFFFVRLSEGGGTGGGRGVREGRGCDAIAYSHDEKELIHTQMHPQSLYLCLALSVSSSLSFCWSIQVCLCTSHTHTYTRACTRTHARAHAHLHTHTRACARSHTHSYTVRIDYRRRCSHNATCCNILQHVATHRAYTPVAPLGKPLQHTATHFDTL